jgi:hypothetical protein
MKKRITAILLIIAISLIAIPTAAISDDVIEFKLENAELTDAGLIELIESGEIPENVNDLLLSNNLITDLSIFEQFPYLEVLHIGNNQISDLAPLANLTTLCALELNSNPINDFTPLSALEHLVYLNLSTTGIEDLTPLSGLTKLIVLDLSNNNIRDLSPLYSLKELLALDLFNNYFFISDVEELMRNIPRAGIITNARHPFTGLANNRVDINFRVVGNTIEFINMRAVTTSLTQFGLRIVGSEGITAITPSSPLYPRVDGWRFGGSGTDIVEIVNFSQPPVAVGEVIYRLEIVGSGTVTITAVGANQETQFQFGTPVQTTTSATTTPATPATTTTSQAATTGAQTTPLQSTATETNTTTSQTNFGTTASEITTITSETIGTDESVPYTTTTSAQTTPLQSTTTASPVTTTTVIHTPVSPTIHDALEILKQLAGLVNNAPANSTIHDALEVLKYLAGLPSVYDIRATTAAITTTSLQTTATSDLIAPYRENARLAVMPDGWAPVAQSPEIERSIDDYIASLDISSNIKEERICITKP